jgi:hypothetical protein
LWRRKYWDDACIGHQILILAGALDHRTRGPRQHSGLCLEAKGPDVLQALLRRFYSHRDRHMLPEL